MASTIDRSGRGGTFEGSHISGGTDATTKDNSRRSVDGKSTVGLASMSV